MIGIILLDQKNRYLVDGNLPKRPLNDKKLLHTLVATMFVPERGIKKLPKSMVNAYWETRANDKGDLGVTIPDIGASDVILVNRTIDDTKASECDKTFRLDDFVKLDTVEVWIKKERLK